MRKTIRYTPNAVVVMNTALTRSGTWPQFGRSKQNARNRMVVRIPSGPPIRPLRSRQSRYRVRQSTSASHCVPTTAGQCPSPSGFAAARTTRIVRKELARGDKRTVGSGLYRNKLLPETQLFDPQAVLIVLGQATRNEDLIRNPSRPTPPRPDGCNPCRRPRMARIPRVRTER